MEIHCLLRKQGFFLIVQLIFSPQIILIFYFQGINGILADEMGLGKTVQSVALLSYLAEVRSFKSQEHNKSYAGLELLELQYRKLPDL